jgi:hypothetical protein
MEIKVAKCSITKEILNAASTSQTVALFEIPVNAYVLHILGRIKTAFAGVTAPKVKVGTSTGTSDYMPNQRIDSAVSLISGPMNKDRCPVQFANYANTAVKQQIIATFSSSSGSFSSLSAGEVEFAVVYLV